MAGKKGFILCVCQGTCPSFTKMDIFGVLSDVRREKLFDYVCLHPQLCVGDGEEFLKVLLSGGETEKLYVAACDPQMQCKMFRDAFEAVGFDKAHHIPLDIRNKTTDEAVAAIKELRPTIREQSDETGESHTADSRSRRPLLPAAGRRGRR